MEWITGIYIILFFFGTYFLSLFFILSAKNYKIISNSPKPTRFPTITLLVPAYNEEDSIKKTIESVMNLEYPVGKKEVIAINDGSKDKTLQILNELKKKYPSLKILDKPNSGKANSLNEGIKIAKGELIGVVDADSYPNKTALLSMIGYFEESDKVGAVTTRVLTKKGSNFLEKYQQIDYAIIAWERKLLDFINSVYVTNGPLSLYRAHILREVGGFNQKIITEDIEVTWHILSKGYTTRMAYDTQVYTNVPTKFSRWNLQRIRWNLGGIQTLFKYRNYFLRGGNMFGNFVIGYIFLSFILSLIGLALMVFKGGKQMIDALFLVPFYFQGFNPALLWKPDFVFGFITVMFIAFMTFAIVYYKYVLDKTEIKANYREVLTYMFIYRTFYLIPFIGSLYKILKRDIRWYTK